MARSSWRDRVSGQRQSRPQVEGLESRRLMAVAFTAKFDSPGFAQEIVTGSDGNLWYITNPVFQGGFSPPPSFSTISDINPTTGAVHSFTLKGFYPATGITAGPDGKLWFSGTAGIGSINPLTDALSTFTLPDGSGTPNGITAGPDGNIWFTLSAGKLGDINPTTKAIAEFPLPKTNSGPTTIVTGPNGNLWFIEIGNNSIGEFNPTTRAVTEFAIPDTQSQASSLAVGPDGNLWFLETNAAKIGDINPTTGVINEYAAGGNGQITSGPNGDLYIGEGGAAVGVGIFNTTTHTETSYGVPPFIEANSLPIGIAIGPDGNVWLGGSNVINKAEIIPANQVAISGFVYLDPGGSGTTDNGGVDNATVFLDLKNDGALDAGDPIAITNIFGYYTFTGLAPGTYTVRIAPYPGNVATFPNNSTQTVTLTGGQLGSPSQLGFFSTSPLIPITYNLSPFGTKNPDVQTAEVNGLYELILGRAPDATGGAAAIAYLKTNGSVEQLASDLLNSAEYESDVVASFYRTFLRRNGSTAEVSAWVAQMQNGLTEKQVATSFLTSVEYSALFPANAIFVQALYGDILGRLPVATEDSAWVAAINAGTTRSQVVAAFLNSVESDTRAVNGLYGNIVATVPDPRTDVAALQAGETPVQLATTLFGSSQFIARANATVG
jgi:streptogramin lyase